MLKNYLKIALRNLLKHKGYSFVNIAGLAVGVACCLLILLYVEDELSYDRFHEKSEQIYRVVLKNKSAPIGKANTPYPLVPALTTEFPEILSTVRFGRDPVLMIYEERRFQEEGFYWTDETVFDLFSFQLLRGDPNVALAAPNSVVLTETTAKKYFGAADPMGKQVTVKIYDGNKLLRMEVTGVVADPPANSHLKFDVLASMKNGIDLYKRFENSWGFRWLKSYVRLPEHLSAVQIEKQLPRLLEKYTRAGASDHQEIILQPLTQVHLYSQLPSGTGPSSDIAYVYLFSVIAFFILLLACVNYVNLSMARSGRRAREIGLRKVVGGRRAQIARQFLGEFLLASGLAMLLAFLIVSLFLPIFNDLAGKELNLGQHLDPLSILVVIGFTLIVALLSGSYPVFLLSAFRPVEALRGKLHLNARGSVVRNSLVVFQFAVSIILMIGTAIVYTQLDLIRGRSLGFSSEQVLLVPIQDRTVQAKLDLMKSVFAEHPNVRGVAATAEEFPSKLQNSWSVRWKGLPEDDRRGMDVVGVDEYFFDLLEMDFVEGRNFSKDYSTDAAQAVVINEAARHEIGWDTAVGKEFEYGNRKGRIVGVVRDYHFQSLHSQIVPLVFFLAPGSYRHSPDNLLAKVATGDLPATLDFLKSKWDQFSPHQPFEYYFIDDSFARSYEAEERLGRLVGYFSLIALAVACLGLLGLTSYSAEQQTKEIGVRKILGASMSSLVTLLSKDFVKLVLVANIVAWPIAFLAMSRWLQDFAYRTNIQAGTFVLAGALALIIALATISFHAIRAAWSNPVKALRYE